MTEHIPAIIPNGWKLAKPLVACRENAPIIGSRMNTPTPITIERCLTETAEAYGLTREQMFLRTRTPPFARARQVVMWLARRYTGRTLEQIGVELGFSDGQHQTVAFGIRSVDAAYARGGAFKWMCDRLCERVTA